MKKIIGKYCKKTLIRVIIRLLNYIYKSDIVDTGMKDLIIGKNGEYETVEEWKLDLFFGVK